MDWKVGIKTCLLALLGEAKRQWWWLLMALLVGSLLWFTPKVKASELSDYMDKAGLSFPKAVLKEAYKQDSVPAYGIMRKEEMTGHNIFIVYFVKRGKETKDIYEAMDRCVMRVRFFECKKTVVVEYFDLRLWAAGEYVPTIIRLELRYL